MCSKCGALLPQSSAPARRNAARASNDERTVRRRAIVITVLLGAMGIVWDVLAAAVLFHSYSFFESVVVCLLVMTLCAVATVRADFELWSGIFSGDVKDSDTAKSKEPDFLNSLRTHLKVLFYAIAFVMALVKLVLTLIG